jgi:hypothetical protein
MPVTTTRATPSDLDRNEVESRRVALKLDGRLHLVAYVTEADLAAAARRQ